MYISYKFSFLQADKLKEQLTEYKMQIADNLCTIEELEDKLKAKSKEYEKSKSCVVQLAKTVQNYQNNTNVSIMKSNCTTGSFSRDVSKIIFKIFKKYFNLYF